MGGSRAIRRASRPLRNRDAIERFSLCRTIRAFWRRKLYAPISRYTVVARSAQRFTFEADRGVQAEAVPSAWTNRLARGVNLAVCPVV
jgi:hypothetical protein